MDKKEHKLYTEKRKHYAIFKQVLLLCGKKSSIKTLPKHVFLSILDIGYNMNLGGKRRK
jgi:hypothetical protein